MSAYLVPPGSQKGSEPRRYDCGDFGLLTRAQICEISGRSKNTIASRIKRGVKGAALCDSKFGAHPRTGVDYRQELHGPQGGCAIFTACSIARAFPHRVPSRQELMDRYRMSRATAYRWLAAWKAAIGDGS